MNVVERLNYDQDMANVSIILGPLAVLMLIAVQSALWYLQYEKDVKEKKRKPIWLLHVLFANGRKQEKHAANWPPLECLFHLAGKPKQEKQEGETK
jgi:hypothetical protein